jgi:hypothetical protein
MPPVDKDKVIDSQEDLTNQQDNDTPTIDQEHKSDTEIMFNRANAAFDNFSSLGLGSRAGSAMPRVYDAFRLEDEYTTPQAGFGDSSYDLNMTRKQDIESGDLNEYRAEQQSGATQIVNGVGKMLGLAGTTFIDGTIGTLWGLGQGIVNAFSDDPNKTFWNGFVDNGISNAMRKTEEWFEKYMPNYRSQYEQNLGLWQSLGTANFWADQIKQMGFTVGTALGATVTGMVTGGAGVMPKLFGNFGKILGMGTKGVNWMERLGLSFMSGFNETKNIVSGGMQDRFNEYNKDNFENYQNELKNLDEVITNETYQRLLDMGYYKSKGEGIPAVIPRPEVFEQFKAQVATEYQSTFDEIKSRYEENSADPKARAVAAGSFELGVGTAFMTVMNMIGQNSVLPSPFTNAERMVQGSATNRIARFMNKKLGLNKFSKDALNEFKNVSIPELALKKVSEGVSEMVEEGGQDIVTDFATNYYGSDNIKSGKANAARLMDSFMTALGDNIHGDAMWKDMQAAFLSTMAGTPIVNKGATQNGKQDRTFTWQGGIVQMIKDAKAEYAKSKETFDFIRSIIDSPERRAAFNLNVYANTQKEKMMEAAAASNEKEWRDHADNISLKAIEAFGSIGRLSDLRALTGDIKNISDEELEALAIGLSSKGEDGKYTSENGAADENGELITNTEEGKKKFKQDLIDNADKFKTMVDNWVDNFNRVDKLTGYQLDRDGLSMLTWGLTQADNWDERIHSMMSTIKEKFPHVLNTIIDTLQQELDNNDKYEQELNSLIAEDKINPSDELKKKIEEVKSKIDPDLNADTYKSVIQAYTKLRDLDLDTNQKGYWNQLIDDDMSMYDLTLDILKGIPMDKLYSDDKGDFLRLLDDIRKCNNSRHNAINVTNQLINNPEEIKRLRKSFLDKEENISLMDAQEQAYKEIKESKSPEGVKEALIKLYDELQDPEKVEKAVKNLREKDSETDKLIDSFIEKMKEKQAIDAQNQGNQLENDRLPAVLNTVDNRQFIENCIKDLINYLQEKYKNSNKSLYRLTTREIADAFWEMLHQPTETGMAGVRTQEAIATPYGVPQNNETLQRIPTDMEFQVVVQKVKQLLKDLYNQAVERGDIDKKQGQVEFIVDDNGNTYYISNNTPVKLQDTKPISITEENSLAKTQSDIATSTPVTIPFDGLEVYDDGIIDVEYEIVNENNQQAPSMSVEDAQSLGEHIETVTAELVQDELDISSEDGSIVIYDNNTVTPESQITYIEEVNEEQLALLEEQQKELQQTSSPLALLEKNQEQERNNMGEVLSKLFTKETSSETSEVDKLSQSLDEAIKNKQAAVERLESLNQQAESLELAPAVPDASLPVSLNDIQAKIAEEKKHIEDLQKQIEDLQKSVKDKETKSKPKLDTDTSNSYLAVLTNISSLKYDGTEANNRYSEKLNTRNEKAMQFFKDSGGMEFVNSGKLAKMVNSNRSITPVYFKREADVEDTVFMYVKVKGEYQCIGYIDNAGKQGVLGYNILYPRQQKANGYYYDVDGNRHEENIAIVDNEGYSTPVDNDNYITLRNADGKVMSIGQFFNGLIYLTDDRTLSEIPVGTNDLKQSVRDGNVGFGYINTVGVKSVTSNDVFNNYLNLQLGTRVVTFTASDGTTTNIQILPNIPVSEWSNRSKQNSDGSDSYINAVNKALMTLSNGIANKETDTWNKLRELFNFFTGQNFDSSNKESIALLTYRYYNTSRGVEIYSEPRGVKGGANYFHIDVKDKNGEVIFNIIFCTDSLLNSAKQLGKDANLGKLIATSIYNQIVNPKLHIQDKETGQWITEDVKPENRLIFNINLNAAMLGKMSDADKKNYLASMSDYCETSARNLETQGTFTVSFQSRKDRTAKINLATMKTGSALTQRAASQAYIEYPAINLSVLNKKVSLTILPETDDNGDYTNNFRLRRTEISGKENVGYYGSIYPKKQFCESIGIKGIENMRTPDFNIFVDKILSCLYDYNNKNANIALPTHTEYSVENGVMSIPEISVIIDLNTMQAYNSIDAFKNSVKSDNKQTKENSNVENTTNENSEIKQETKEEKKEELPDKKAETLKLTGNTLGKSITGLSKRKGFGGIKRHKKGIANGTKIYVKEGKIKAKNFLSNNLSSFEREGIDKSILDYLGRYVEDDVTIEILSDDDFTKKYGSDTLGVCDGNKVYLRPSTSIDTIVHELAHAVTIKLTKRALKMENTEDSPIRTLISILNEIRQLRNDNPNIFKDTNVDYFLNQPDLNSQIDEMIGEIFGDKKLQQILKGQHISTKESTAENKPKSIINLIREFLRRLFRVFGANKQQLSNMISIFDEFKESVEGLQNTKDSEFNEDSLRFDIDQSELQSIKEKTIADGTFMKAPNGKPTNLNERQWLQVRTKAFKDWFGDWTKITFDKDDKVLHIPDDVSKIVDENGEPLVVYHASDKQFSVYQPSWSENGFSSGMFFSSSKRYAEKVANAKVKDAVFLNIKNPMFADDLEREKTARLFLSEEPVDGGEWVDKFGTDEGYKEYVEETNSSRHDGIIGNDAGKEVDGKLIAGEESTEYVTRNPNQIKSATDNVGTFSRENNDIRYRKEVKEQQEVSKLNKDLNNFLKSLNFDVQVDLNNPSHFDAIAKTLRYKNDEELLDAAVDILIDIPVKSKLIEILRNYIKPTGVTNDEFVRNLYNSNYRDIFATDINNSKKALKEFILNKYNENKESRFVRFIKYLINNIRSWVKGNDMFGYFEANHIFEMITSEVPKADFIKWVDPSGEVQKRIDSITVPQDVATILNNNQLASSLIREFNKDGLALGGSISIAADGYLARKSEGSLHDLDMVWTTHKTAEESQKYLESNRYKFAKLGLYYATNSVGKYGVQIGDNTLGLVPFITTPVDNCEKITNGEFKFYKNGTLVCHYKDDKVISGDAEVIIVDFLSPNPNSKPVTRYYNDKKYLFNTYNGAMRFKYDKRRVKDVADYINFFKKPIINDDILTEYCNSTGISKDDFNKLPDSVKDLALKCKS